MESIVPLERNYPERALIAAATRRHSKPIPAPSSEERDVRLDDLVFGQLLDEVAPESSRRVLLPHQVVIGHAAELVVATRREVPAILPFTTLQLDVALLLA